MSIPQLDRALALCVRAGLEVTRGSDLDPFTVARVLDAQQFLEEAGADPAADVVISPPEAEGRTWVELLRAAAAEVDGLDSDAAPKPAALLPARMQLQAAILAGEE